MTKNSKAKTRNLNIRSMQEYIYMEIEHYAKEKSFSMSKAGEALVIMGLNYLKANGLEEGDKVLERNNMSAYRYVHDKDKGSLMASSFKSPAYSEKGSSPKPKITPPSNEIFNAILHGENPQNIPPLSELKGKKEIFIPPLPKDIAPAPSALENKAYVPEVPRATELEDDDNVPEHKRSNVEVGKRELDEEEKAIRKKRPECYDENNNVIRPRWDRDIEYEKNLIRDTNQHPNRIFCYEMTRGELNNMGNLSLEQSRSLMTERALYRMSVPEPTYDDKYMVLSAVALRNTYNYGLSGKPGPLPEPKDLVLSRPFNYDGTMPEHGYESLNESVICERWFEDNGLPVPEDRTMGALKQNIEMYEPYRTKTPISNPQLPKIATPLA